VDSLSQSVERLSIQVNSELKASETRIEGIKEATDRSFWVLIVLGAIGSIIGGAFVLGERAQEKQHHKDYMEERTFYEQRARRYERRQQETHQQMLSIAKSNEERNDAAHGEVLKLYQNQVIFGQGVEERAKRYEQRQEGIHEQMIGIAKKTEERNEAIHGEILQLYKNQVLAGQGVVDQAERLSKLVETNLKEINTITTAVASGATQNVQTLNEVLAAFQRIMEFKVAEAKDAKQLVEQMQRELDELEMTRKQQIEELLQNATRLIRKRFDYASPAPDLQRLIVEFRTKMDGIQETIIMKYTGANLDGRRNWHYGEIFLRRGVIAYFENDPAKARDLLKTAEKFFPFSEELLQGMPKDQRYATAFMQFYLALIEKNYGDIRQAQNYIENSYIAWGRNVDNELLTPTTRAEILSYAPGGIDKAREAIAEIVQRVSNLKRGGLTLAKHDAICALRAHLLLGNTYYLEGKWNEALSHYKNALKEDEGKQYSYYAYHSIAQVLRKLGKARDAGKMLEHAYKHLLESQHLQTKIASDTRISLNALGYLCTHGKKAKEAAQYRQAIQDHWLKIQKIDDLELRLFSLEQKRQVSKEEFWNELFKE